MAYRLEAGEAIPAAIPRIVGEQVDGAIAQLRGEGLADRDEAVHDARKRMKKARAALRLVRSEIGGESFRRENEVYRDAARRLAPVRDAQVLVETASWLSDDVDGHVATRGLGTLLSLLEAEREQTRRLVIAERGEMEAAAADLEAVRPRIDELPLRRDSFRTLGRGVRRTYKRGLRRERDATRQGTVQAFHEWRKRVKDLWYHVRILEPVWPPGIAPLHAALDELGDLLGRHHDLAVLASAAERHRDELGARHATAVTEAIGRRGVRLEETAHALARRPYADRPRAFADRLEAWFRAWREAPLG